MAKAPEDATPKVPRDRNREPIRKPDAGSEGFTHEHVEWVKAPRPDTQH